MTAFDPLRLAAESLAPRLRELAADEGGDETVTCPGCWTEVAAETLCEHDDENTGPLCPDCCEIEHQVEYRRWVPDGGDAA